MTGTSICILLYRSIAIVNADHRTLICCLGFFFFFQAEDGIRDLTVTGVQTCALPISHRTLAARRGRAAIPRVPPRGARRLADLEREPVLQAAPAERPARAHRQGAGVEIGRASCRERV